MRPRPVPGPSPAPVPGPRRRAGAVDTPWQDTSPLCGRPTADLGSILPHARDETTAAAAATTTARPTPQSRLQGLRRGPEGTRPAPPPEAQNFFLIPPYAGARGGLSCWQSSHYRNTMTDTELATHVGQRSDDRPDRTIGRSPLDARPIAVRRGQWDSANAVNPANFANDLPQAPPGSLNCHSARDCAAPRLDRESPLPLQQPPLYGRGSDPSLAW